MPIATTNCDMLGQIISYYLNDDTTVHNHLPFIMDVILTRSLLKDQEESEELTAVRRKWTIRLNSLMQSKQPTARWAAIILIKLTCEQSPLLLYGHIRSWVGQLIGLAARPASAVVHKAAIETLAYLFSYTSNKPELQREITIPNLPRFNQLLLGLSKDEVLLPTILSAVKSSIIHFPSQSRHIADQTLKLCVSCLDGRMGIDKETILAACQCLASLHHVTGKSSSADQWKDTMLHLIGSIHGCLDRLFDTIDEELELSELPPSYSLPPLSPDPIEAFPTILRRVRSLNRAIVTCLGSQTLTVVSVPVVQLIDLACRVYNAFDGSLMREFKDKTEFICLMSCLPSLHFSTNKMISALFLSSGSHLSRYSKLFSRILIRLLNEYKGQRTIKISVYNIISLCLQQFGYVFGESVCKPLVTSIMEDIHITEQKVTDKVPTETKNKSMKRKRDGLTNSDLLATAGQSTQRPHDIQVSALGSLHDLLYCYGSSMDLHSRNTIDAKLISRLLLAAQNTLGSATEGELLVKEKLYQSLLASVMNPIEVQATILPHAIRIFSAGVNEQNHKLQTICNQGLAICNLIIHPRMPPIQTSLNTFKTKVNQAEQSVSTATTHDNVPATKYPLTKTAISTDLLQPVENDKSTSSDLGQTTENIDTITVDLLQPAENGNTITPDLSTEHISPPKERNPIVLDLTTEHVNPAKEIDPVPIDTTDNLEPVIYNLNTAQPSFTATTTSSDHFTTATSQHVGSDIETSNDARVAKIDNIIRFDDDDDDDDQEDNAEPTNVPHFKSNTITFDDLEGDDDDDLALPEIDMAGPDTDDGEQDEI